jgi:hypothetical protein
MLLANLVGRFQLLFDWGLGGVVVGREFAQEDSILLRPPRASINYRVQLF